MTPLEREELVARLTNALLDEYQARVDLCAAAMWMKRRDGDAESIAHLGEAGKVYGDASEDVDRARAAVPPDLLYGGLIYGEALLLMEEVHKDRLERRTGMGKYRTLKPPEARP